VQARTRIRTVRDQDGGDRTGFQGKRYRTVKVGTASFADKFDDFFEFMEPRLEEVRRLLKPSGSFFLHIDYREVHYCKVLLDHLFGRDSFINEIVWAEGPQELHVQLRRDGPDSLHGSGTRRKGKGCQGQDADGRVVAHDRTYERQGAYRLPDPEAGRNLEPHHQGPQPSG
jgi:hypothetical protein